MSAAHTFTTVVTASHRGATLRSVNVTFPNVAPPGVAWEARHEGRKFEMVSYKGGRVELYVCNAEGLPMHYGTVRQYAPGEGLRQAFREAWYKEQPSAAARAAFEASASEEAR